MDYNSLCCSINSVRICNFLFFLYIYMFFFHLHNCTILKNMLLIPFIRFGAHKPNGFLAPFVIHYLSAEIGFEWAYCLVMIYQPLCTPWMHVIVMCDNKDIWIWIWIWIWNDLDAIAIWHVSQYVNSLQLCVRRLILCTMLFIWTSANAIGTSSCI